MKAFIVALSVFSALLGAAGAILWKILPDGFITPALPFLFPLYFAVGLIVQKLLIRSAEKSPRSFILHFMASTAARLLFYATIMLVYVFVNKPDAKPFLFAFFGLYLCYTVFEVVYLLKFLKSFKK